uniref:Uncharacterized protein n=1 Tax=viral metagenome TaxID=1070528 RepID=A0A6C0K3N1_9ZZZZ
MSGLTPETVRGIIGTAVQINPANAPAALSALQNYDLAYQANQDSIVQNDLQNQVAAAQQQNTTNQGTISDLQSQIAAGQAALSARIAADAAALTAAVNAQRATDVAAAEKCTQDDITHIETLVASYNLAARENARLVSAGNANFSPSLSQDLSGEIQQLEQKRAELKASIEQHSRDFVDLRDAMPERIPDTNVHILDDYTMWVLVLSYSLFIFSVIFYYCHIHSYALNSILISTISAGILTIFIFILMILLL